MTGAPPPRRGWAESRGAPPSPRRSAPVLYPDTDAQRPYEWPGGVEDPRIVEAEDGSYVLTYTQWNRRIPRLAVATSRDLVHWTKQGPAFAQAYGGKYLDLESKSGAILARVRGVASSRPKWVGCTGCTSTSPTFSSRHPTISSRGRRSRT